jgi:hypothetical protein
MPIQLIDYVKDAPVKNGSIFNGMTVRMVDSSILYDYEGMNPTEAKNLDPKNKMGIKDNEVLLNEDVLTDDEGTKETTNHELNEDRILRGDPSLEYWEVHTALQVQQENPMHNDAIKPPEVKYNENHDPENGQFAEGDGGGDENSGWGKRSEPSKEYTKTEIVNDIKDTVANDDSTSHYYGLRSLPDYEDKPYKEGQTLEPSYRWEDGKRRGKLDGVSCVGLTDYGENAEWALTKVQTYGYDQIALVVGDNSKGGEDEGEAIIRNASIVTIYQKNGNTTGSKSVNKSTDLKRIKITSSKSMPEVGVKNMPKMIYKSFRANVIKYDDATGIIDMLIPMNSGQMDRSDEVCTPKSWEKRLPIFMKRPILVSSHTYDDLRKQIGEFVTLRVTDEGLMGTPKYYINDGNEEADWAYKLAKRGMAAFSVGFKPYEFETAKKDGDPAVTYTDSELFEISQVVVPCDREAIQNAIKAKSVNPVVNQLLQDIMAAEIVDLTETKKEYSQEEIADEIDYLSKMIGKSGIKAMRDSAEIEVLCFAMLTALGYETFKHYDNALIENGFDVRRLTVGDTTDNIKDLVKCKCDGCATAKCKCIGEKCTDKDCACGCHDSNKSILSIFQVKYNENHDPDNGQFAEGDGGGGKAIGTFYVLPPNELGSRAVIGGRAHPNERPAQMEHVETVVLKQGDKYQYKGTIFVIRDSDTQLINGKEYPNSNVVRAIVPGQIQKVK